MSLKNNKFSGLTLKFSLLIASCLAFNIFLHGNTPRVNAFESGNGSKAFINSPRLIRTAATNAAPNNPAKYHFTIKVPENAGESLKAVNIRQKDNLEKIEFNVNKSTAFLGDSFAGGETVNLVDSDNNLPQDSEITIVFDKPIEPGNTVTIALKTSRNPFFGSIYQFGVTAFPEGENSAGLYLGSGRLRLSRN